MSTLSDSGGRYSVAGLPVWGVSAWLSTSSRESGYVQPCAAAPILMSSDTTTDFQLVSVADAAAGVATALVTSSESRAISGTVFEPTPNGRHPVQGAWVGWDADNVRADTRSDAVGHYALCGLPNTRVSLFAERVTASGPTFMPIEIWAEAGSNTLDIEFLK